MADAVKTGHVNHQHFDFRILTHDAHGSVNHPILNPQDLVQDFAGIHKCVGRTRCAEFRKDLLHVIHRGPLVGTEETLQLWYSLPQ